MRTLIIIAAIAAIAATAGDSRADVVVLESYPGARPAEASRLLAPLMDELESAGYKAGSSVGAKVEQLLSRSGGLMSGDDLSEATKLVDAGYSSFLKNDLQEAVDKLTRALDRFHASPATIAQDQARRDLVQTSLVGLTMAHKRLGHSEDAERYMAELIRSFPDREFNRTKYGPEAHDFYTRIRSELGSKGRGSLSVKVDDENVVVFLNERFEAVGSIHKTDLLPGTYRVYVQKGTSPGRLHVVTVEPQGEVQLKIEWNMEAALHTGADWVGFSFANTNDRRTMEPRFATKLALAVGATSIILISIEPREGHRSIVGTVISIDTGHAIRSGVVAMDPTEPTAEQIRGLGRFLSGGKAEPGIVVSGPDLAMHDESPSHPLRFWKWVTLVGAAAGLGVGVGFIVLNGSCKDPVAGATCRNLYTTMVPGLAITGVGVALGALTTYLFIKDSASKETKSITFAPLRGGFAVGASWQF